MTRWTTVFILALALTAVAQAQQAIDETRTFAPDGMVEVDNLAGTVEVIGGSHGQVRVTGTLARGAERLEVEGNSNRLEIKVVLPRDARNVGSSHLKVEVPTRSRVNVETVSADVTVRGVEGAIDLQTVSGAVTVSGMPAELEVATVSGNVAVDTSPRGSEIESVSGRIEVAAADRSLDAATVSGGIRISGGVLENAELSTTSGSIRCEVDLVGHGSIEMESMSGSVTLVVPAGVAADFELSTFSGSIDNDIGPEPQRTSRFTPGAELDFSTGSGGPRVAMQSFSGSVRLLTR